MAVTVRTEPLEAGLLQALGALWVTHALRTGLSSQMPVQWAISLAPPPSGWMVLYSALYLLAVLAAGQAVFRRRDL